MPRHGHGPQARPKQQSPAEGQDRYRGRDLRVDRFHSLTVESIDWSTQSHSCGSIKRRTDSEVESLSNFSGPVDLLDDIPPCLPAEDQMSFVGGWMDDLHSHSMFDDLESLTMRDRRIRDRELDNRSYGHMKSYGRIRSSDVGSRSEQSQDRCVFQRMRHAEHYESFDYKERRTHHKTSKHSTPPISRRDHSGSRPRQQEQQPTERQQLRVRESRHVKSSGHQKRRIDL